MGIVYFSSTFFFPQIIFVRVVEKLESSSSKELQKKRVHMYRTTITTLLIVVWALCSWSWFVSSCRFFHVIACTLEWLGIPYHMPSKRADPFAGNRNLRMGIHYSHQRFPSGSCKLGSSGDDGAAGLGTVGSAGLIYRASQDNRIEPVDVERGTRRAGN